MNIFDDLLEELKEQNLIEETVTEKKKRISQEESNAKADSQTVNAVADEPVNETEGSAVAFSQEDGSNDNPLQPSNNEDREQLETLAAAEPEDHTSVANLPDEQANDKTLTDSDSNDSSSLSDLPEPDEKNAAISDVMSNMFDESGEDHSATKLESLNSLSEKSEENLSDKKEAEFFRRRAMEEVTFLQMVEHVMSGVEREQLKSAPKAYNDISVSQALHSFLQIASEGNKQKTAEAEFQLMQETQAWYFALIERDNLISVAALRRYCETTRPVLSTQAVAALARFYRNAPFTESVRGKFDMVITRLFSRDAGNERRELLFSQEEIVAHLNELYADWRSIPATTKDQESEELLQALKFADFLEEARKADCFEDLAKNDFFNRVRSLKASIGDKFFSPFIVAAVIESNIKIGNRYVELIEIERERNETEVLWEKYGVVIDQALSESSSKTMQLVELLNEKAAEDTAPEEKNNKQAKKSSKKAKVKKGSAETQGGKLLGALAINKWLLAACLLTFVATGGLYVWVEYFAVKMEASPNVQTLDVENTALKPYLKTAKVHEGTFYGFTEPNWNMLSTEKKQEVLKMVLAAGKEKGYKKVQFMNSEGRKNGYASEEKLVAEE